MGSTQMPPRLSRRLLTAEKNYKRLSERLRRITAAAFMMMRIASNTMMAADGRSTNARFGLRAHRKI
jgi:hypothetical protein